MNDGWRMIAASLPSIRMTETEFTTLAEQTIDAIEAAVEAANASEATDIEIERSGNVLTLELVDRSKVVINSQTPMQQLWVAARSGGFHYAMQDGRWRDTRDGSELFAALSRIISQQGGQGILLKPE
jgi:CyaY protein